MSKKLGCGDIWQLEGNRIGDSADRSDKITRKDVAVQFNYNNFFNYRLTTTFSNNMYDALKTSYGFQNVLKNENASEDGGFSHMYALHCFTHIKMWTTALWTVKMIYIYLWICMCICMVSSLISHLTICGVVYLPLYQLGFCFTWYGRVYFSTGHLRLVLQAVSYFWLVLILNVLRIKMNTCLRQHGVLLPTRFNFNPRMDK